MAIWTDVRLELASTCDFPHGSAVRHYLLNLPLGTDRTIDAMAQAAQPDHVTVRRFWPKEPDRRGHLIRVPEGWAFSFAISGQSRPDFCQLRDHPIRLHETVTIAETPDLSLPYLVAAMSTV